jgi:F-type H+-transporting ATPase subunit a
VSEENVKKRRPIKRWIILALVAFGIYAAFLGPSILKPVSPVVVLPPEPTGLSIGEFQVTNTILATLLTDLVLLLVAGLGVRRFIRSGTLVPTGIYNAFEAIVEFLWNTVVGTVGRWARAIFPIVATIFLLIFFANLLKLIPGFESIGYLKEAHKPPAYAPVRLLPGLYTIDKGQPVEVTAEAGGEAAEDAEHSAPSAELCHACEVVPFLRGPATDLNFTLALAVTAVVMIQVIGVRAHGMGYFEKFFQFRRLISGGLFGTIDFAVGFLEIILEFSRILSFAFRLFGNIFAGALLLSIVGALTAVVVPAGLYLFEIFFGIIQAYVFFLLATVFMNMATAGHGGGHEEGQH